MKKKLISVVIISVVASLTAILLNRAIKLFTEKRPLKPVVEIQKDTAAKVNTRTTVSPKDTLIAVITPPGKNDDALSAIIDVQNYLNNGKAHTLPEVAARLNKLTLFYKIKGLNSETNAQLKAAIQKLKDKRSELNKENSKRAMPKDTMRTDTGTIY